MLRLLYGNDKRNPIRTLDLAESASGHIFLKTGGFAPGSGERNELWSGSSIRFDGQRKLAESRQNTQLVVTYDLYAGSMTGLSELQRKINQFLNEARTYHTLMQGEKVWLEYRWSDNLSTLPTPKFGQLSYFYEVYSGNVPKWPDDLHTGALISGNVEGVALELTCSPYSEGLAQGAGYAYGGVTMVTEGVRVNGANTWLKWLYCANSGMTGTFTVTGWMTAYWTSPGQEIIFKYSYNGANLVQLWYNGPGSQWVITKIFGGTTFTATSATDTVSTGDDVHLVMVQDATTLRLYVNGVEAASVLATASLPDEGHITLGCAAVPTTNSGTGSNVALDGWRIFADDITSTQAASLYAAELPIKTAGGQVGPPPFIKNEISLTPGAGEDGQLRRIVGGIGGDIPAEANIFIQPISTTGYFGYGYLGLKLSETALYGIDDYFNFVYFNDSDQTGLQMVFYETKTAKESEVLRGRYRLLGAINASNVSMTITPKYSFGNWGESARVAGNPTTYTGTGNFSASAIELVDLGDLFISPPDGIDPVDIFTLSLSVVTNVTGSPVRVILNQLILMPYPYNMVTPTNFEIAVGEPGYGTTIQTPYTLDSGTGGGQQIMIGKSGAAGLELSRLYGNFAMLNDVSYVIEPDMQRLGSPIFLHPGKHNYLSWSHYCTNEYWVSGRVTSLTVFVTPRYLLPGGMVA